MLNKSYGETIVLHILKYLVIGYNIMIPSFKIGMGEPIYKPLAYAKLITVAGQLTFQVVFHISSVLFHYFYKPKSDKKV